MKKCLLNEIMLPSSDQSRFHAILNHIQHSLIKAWLAKTLPNIDEWMKEIIKSCQNEPAHEGVHLQCAGTGGVLLSTATLGEVRYVW